MIRCSWCGDDPLYQQYHDNEWGRAVHDDTKLFEFLILEGAQAGLSWITILRKRENYRKAFDNFDFEMIAKYNEKKIAELMSDSGIVRNRLKINSAVINAQAFLKVREEYGTFDKYIWSFTENRCMKGNWNSLSEIPVKSELSDKISKDLKKRGFKFVGSTIIYSYLQAVGIVDDHIKSCFCY